MGYGPSGGYDAYAGVIARHMGKYLAGAPNITVQNMPGAASLRATNFIYASAPKDGSIFGTVARDVGLIGLVGDSKSVQLDPLRFTWIGSARGYEDDAYLFWVRKSVADSMKEGVSARRSSFLSRSSAGTLKATPCFLQSNAVSWMVASLASRRFGPPIMPGSRKTAR